MQLPSWNNFLSYLFVIDIQSFIFYHRNEGLNNIPGVSEILSRSRRRWVSQRKFISFIIHYLFIIQLRILSSILYIKCVKDNKRAYFFFSLKSPAPPLGYLGHSAHITRSSSICFIHNMYRYSIQIQDGPVWSGLEN